MLIAKTRLAPTRSITIPKLELLGAVLAAKLVNLVQREVHGLEKV